MGKKAPKPPDYAAAAEQTAAGDRDAARYATYANRIDQTNPWGSINYESYLDTDPATGEEVTRWRQNQTLTPEAQAALDSQMAVQQGRSSLAEGMLGDIGQDYGERMDFDQFGQPIGMGEQGRMGGAGEGISSGGGMVGGTGGNFSDMPAYQRQQLQKGLNFEDNTQQALDYGDAPDVNSPEWTRQAAEESIYNRGASRLDPQIEQESEALEVKLRSQGLKPGDEAYEAQMNSFNQRKTDAYDALQARAMEGGAQQAESMFGMESQYRDQATGEQDRMGDFWNQATQQRFGIEQGMGDFANQAALGQMGADLAARMGEGNLRTAQGQLGNQAAQIANQAAMGNWNMQNQAQQQAWNQQRQQLGYNTDQAYRENALANQLRSQGMNESMQQRAYRLNELNSLLSGQQVNAPSFNSFAQQGQTSGPDYLGAAGTQYEADMGQYGANQAMWNSLMGGVGQGVGMMGMFSDRRLKRNIQKIAEIDGVNWYEFDYIWGEHAVGVMADEVPHAASMHPSGYLMVDYSKI